MTTGKLKTINEAFNLPGPTVAYSGALARALDGDVCTALLFCQCWYWSKGGAIEYDRTMPQVEHAIGLSVPRQKRSRRLLVKKGWLSERVVRRRGCSILLTIVHPDAVAPDLREWLDANARAQEEAEVGVVSYPQVTGDGSKDAPQIDQKVPPRQHEKYALQDPIQDQEREEEQGSRVMKHPPALALVTLPDQQQQPIKPKKPTEAEIISGALDDTPAAGSLAVCAVICAVMDRDWHGGQRKVVPGKRNQALVLDHVSAGGRVSDVLKAVHGMRHDDWQDRGRFTELRHVFGKLGEWVRLYDERHVKGDRPIWPRAQHRQPEGFRPWRGIHLPADREPTNGDQLALEAGYVFAFDARQWVDPADDPRGLVAAHRLRYGDANVTPQALARIQAAEAKRARG